MYTGTLSLTQGDSFSWNLTASDSSGNALNLSGMTGVGYIKLNYGGSGILDQFNFNIMNPASGLCNVSLQPIQTSSYPVTQGVYGIYIFSTGFNLNSGTFQADVAQGYLNIFPELVPNFKLLFTGLNTGNIIYGGGF